MLVIRLRRVGKKNKPSYRIVVAEHSYPVNGKFTADLGYYNPHTKTVGFEKKEVVEWMNKGAQPSNTVAKLLKKEKVQHSSVVVVKKKAAPKNQEAAPTAKQDVAPEATSEAIAAEEPITESTEESA